MRARRPAPRRASSNPLPAEIAGGPDPAVWPEPVVKNWIAAGNAWSVENLGSAAAWRDLLGSDVRYATSSLGRTHRREGSYVAPWERP